MPTYDYKCKNCGKEFEYTQKMSDKALTECIDTSCKGEVYRVFSKNIGLVFKGSGFYLTDYANKNSSIASSNENKSESKTSTEHTCSGGCCAPASDVKAAV